VFYKITKDSTDGVESNNNSRTWIAGFYKLLNFSCPMLTFIKLTGLDDRGPYHSSNSHVRLSLSLLP
jgi:hypothetical protein